MKENKLNDCHLNTARYHALQKWEKPELTTLDTNVETRSGTGTVTDGTTPTTS